MKPTGADLERIRRLALIEHLPAQVQDELLTRASAVLEIPAGEQVYAQGQQDNFVNYLLRGRVERSVNGVIIGTIDGDRERWREPLDDTARKTEAIRALSPTTILRVHRGELERTYQQITSCEGDGTLEVMEITSDTSTDWRTRLLRSKVFSRLSASSIQTVFDRMEEVNVSAGTEVIRQGAPGDSYYVVQSGVCQVLRRPSAEQREVRLAELGPGDGFGEEALIANAPRNATVRMLTDGKLMRLGKADFMDLLVEPLVRGVSFRQGRWLVGQGASWVDAREWEAQGPEAIAGAIRIPLHLVRTQARRLDEAGTYVVCSENVRQGVLAAFLMAAHGLDAVYLEEPLSQVPLAHSVTGRENPTSAPAGPDSINSETTTMSDDKKHDGGQPAAGRPAPGNGSGPDAPAPQRLERHEFAETTTGEELAELIDELYRQREELVENGKPVTGTPTPPAPVGDGVGRSAVAAGQHLRAERGPVAASTGAGHDDSLIGIGADEVLGDIVREIDSGLSDYVSQCVQRQRAELEARVEERLARMEQLARQRVEAYERELKERYDALHVVKEKELSQAYDRLTSLANRISHQKADIQKARKALESMLQTASRVHREVYRVGNALVDQIDHLEVLNEDISFH